jgi:hypothetical protein
MRNSSSLDRVIGDLPTLAFAISISAEHFVSAADVTLFQAINHRRGSRPRNRTLQWLFKVDFKTIDQVLIKKNGIPIKKLIPLVYRSYILSIGSFNALRIERTHTRPWERLVAIQLFDRPVAMSVRTRMRSKS